MYTSSTIVLSKSGVYSIQRSDPPSYDFELKNVTLNSDSNKNVYSATITINILSIENGQKLDEVSIEVKKAENSIYKYNILSAKVKTFTD